MQYDENYVKALLPKRPKNSHKGTFGHVLNIAGSEFYSGAAYFSSLAPLKVGCGRITLASCDKVLKTVSALSPDIILLPLSGKSSISPNSIKTLKAKIEDYDAISIGCGLSINKDTIKFFEEFINLLNKSKKPLVIDADGLNIIAELNTYPSNCPLRQGAREINLPQNTILTPHPKELSRLMEMRVETILAQPEFWAKKCSEKYNCITILKTHKTIVSDNLGKTYINNSGNTALSKGGSGDVLCGMISGFLAQGLNPFEASVLGVYLHGKTAEYASNELTEYSVLASELLNYIHVSIKDLI